MAEADELRTDRLVLEPLRVEHAEEMFVVLADPHLYVFIGGGPPDHAALTERYRGQVDGSGRHDERWFNWIARRSHDGMALGYVQATATGDQADVAWLIGTAHQRQGFASEAAGAMVRWLTARGVERFTAHIAVDHTGSSRVAQSLGMKPTGEVDDDGERIWARSGRAEHAPS